SARLRPQNVSHTEGRAVPLKQRGFHGASAHSVPLVWQRGNMRALGSHGKQSCCTKSMQFCLEPARAMEWSDLKVFLAIAREGTLGGAARNLGQTQPTMGRRLRALESAVGHTLFQRTADGFVLTDEGNAVLGHVERMEEEAIALQRQLA